MARLTLKHLNVSEDDVDSLEKVKTLGVRILCKSCENSIVLDFESMVSDSIASKVGMLYNRPIAETLSSS